MESGEKSNRWRLSQVAGGAPRGNHNAVKGKRWQEALIKVLAQYESKEAGIEMGQALERIAKKVVELALLGDKDSWQEIGNRLDGKPAQALEHSGVDGAPLHIFEKRFVGPEDSDRSSDSQGVRTAH
jgi:hypothetical protein